MSESAARDLESGLLGRALARVYAALVRHAARGSEGLSETLRGDEEGAERAEDSGAQAPGALHALQAGFGLSAFERDVLVLCAGFELDGRFAEAVAAAHRDPARSQPTLALALAVLDGAHYSAVLPSAPLRRFGLIELREPERSDTLLGCPLRIAEPVLHHLVGLPAADPGLWRLREVAGGELPPLPRYEALRDRAAAVWARIDERAGTTPVCMLYGSDRSGQRAVISAACAVLGRRLFAIEAPLLPDRAEEQEVLLRAWARQAVLGRAALVLDCHEVAPEARTALAALVDRLAAPLFLCCREPVTLTERPCVRIAVERLSPSEQRVLWRSALRELAAPIEDELDALAAHFQLDLRTLTEIAAMRPAADGEPGAEALWQACRAATRQPLDGLAQRVLPSATWDELVLPAEPIAALREIADQVRVRARVLGEWGFGRGARGQGITALFVGPSGTGKTLAAEVLATELRLDLYHIDLSQVVSKYIGETEKNLRRVFDAAEATGAILLFDEADALFGRRSEVKDSHDRYANIEVSYLLQRMESYRGLAILTTNNKGALDGAFLRRLGFVVQFPFPDSSQRGAIWSRVFPAETPLAELDYAKLARLQLGGGNIRGIALRAAYLAASEGAKVEMRHLLAATRSEHAKLERPLSPSDVGDWS